MAETIGLWPLVALSPYAGLEQPGQLAEATLAS